MNSIVVGVDFSDVTDKVLSTAAKLARALGGDLHLVHICAPEPAPVGYETYMYPGPDELSGQLEAEKRRLKELVDKLRADGVNADASMKEAPVVSGLLDCAREKRAGMIVLGSHGHGMLTRMLLGSVAEGVIRKAAAPVLVVPVRDEG